jgi:hypothetical protein
MRINRLLELFEYALIGSLCALAAVALLVCATGCTQLDRFAGVATDPKTGAHLKDVGETLATVGGAIERAGQAGALDMLIAYATTLPGGTTIAAALVVIFGAYRILRSRQAGGAVVDGGGASDPGTGTGA